MSPPPAREESYPRRRRRREERGLQRLRNKQGPASLPGSVEFPRDRKE